MSDHENKKLFFRRFNTVTEVHEAVVDGLQRAGIQLPKNRVWFYGEIMRYSFCGSLHLFNLVSVLVLAYSEVQNISEDQVSDEKIEEIKALYGLQHFVHKELSFACNRIKLFIGVVLRHVSGRVRCYKCSFNGLVYTIPEEWGFNSPDLRVLLNLKKYQTIKAYTLEGDVISAPSATGFYNLVVENTRPNKFVDEDGQLWIEMLELDPI